MPTVYIVAFFALVGGLFSLAGGFLLLANRERAHKLVTYVTPFAAGALLAAAFTDLLPEAAHAGDVETALRWTMGGVVVFFLLERFVRWFHHHHEDEQPKAEATTPLIVIGDTLHNAVDGIAIAAAFLVDVPTGIITTLAVAAHEIPQELGDFGLLLKKGMSRASVIKVNILSALATTVAAVVFYQLGNVVQLPLDVVLGLVAGFFIYIAVSDVIPSIHESEGSRLAGMQTAMLVIGIVLVSLVTMSLHRYIDAESGHVEETGHTEVHTEDVH